MISANVNVVGGWGQDFARRVNRQVRIAVEQASEDGARVAGAAAPRRTGRMATMETLPVKPTPTGWSGGFFSRAFYAGWQSTGTLGSRSRKVKAATLRRRQSASGQARLARVGSSRGIKGSGFLEKGGTAARKSLIERLNRL